jgi:hypothetical protein
MDPEGVSRFRTSLLRWVFVAVALGLAGGCSRPSAANDDREDYDLVGAMAALQRWTDKLGRAGAAENWPLADFYLHEIEELSADLVAAGVVYHGQPVGRYTGVMLVPVVEAVEEAVKTGDAALFRERYTLLVQTCNACHVTTGYGHLVMTEPDLSFNPWPQDFRPRARP